MRLLSNNENREAWWASGHAPVGTRLSEIERQLHDSWLSYYYDNQNDCLLVSLKTTETASQTVYSIITAESSGDIRIISYTALPLIHKEDRSRVRKKLAEINGSSVYARLHIDNSTGIVVFKCEISRNQPDGPSYILPILIEQSRSLTRHYDYIISALKLGCPRPCHIFGNFYDLRLFDVLTINKISDTGDEIGIFHERQQHD